MAITLNKGTIEYIKVVVVDHNPDTAITDLSTHTPQFKIDDIPFTTNVVAYTTATASGMILYCLIDTTIAGFIAGDTYGLYVKFDVSPEFPVLGPATFKVV